MAKSLVHEDAVSGRVGLMVAGMRHGVHEGYVHLISWMLSDCDTAIIALGPSIYLTHEARMTMLRAIFGPMLKFVQLHDIDANEDTDDWIDYVLDRIESAGLPMPTDYYTGSAADARWYENRFARLDDPSESLGPRTTWTSPQSGRRLNILDRRTRPELQGSDIGTLIQRRDDEWKRFVPAKLHRYIEQHYAPNHRVAIKADMPPADVPIGTRWTNMSEHPRMIYELKPDGKWRTLREARSRNLNPS